MKKLYLLLLLCLSAIVTAQAQQVYSHTIIKTSPSEEARTILLDRQGLIWIGTSSGLKSYDGYSFRSFRQTVRTPDLLPNNTIRSLTDDLDDGLWIGTDNGLVRMNRRTGESRTYHLPNRNQQIIYTLFTARDGTVWIGTDGGLTRYLPETDSFETVDGPDATLTRPDGVQVPMVHGSVKSIVEDEEGYLYIGTWSSGLFRYRPGSSMFQAYPPINDKNSTFALLLDSRGRLWIGSWGWGMYLIDNPKDHRNPHITTCSTPQHDAHTYTRLVEDTLTHTVWAGHLNGLSVFRMDQPEAGGTDYRLPDSKTPLYCTHLTTDGQGNIYVASIYEGVLHLNTQQSPFSTWSLHITDPNGAPSCISALCATPQRKVWLGMKPYGLALLDLDTGETLFNEQIPALQHISSHMLHMGFSSIARWKEGEHWMANSGWGIVVCPPQGNAYQLKGPDVPWLADNFVNYLYADRQGRMLVGQRTRLSIVYPDRTGRVLELRDSTDNFSRCDVRHIMQDHHGRYWISTNDQGIICIEGGLDPDGTPRCHRYTRHNGGYATLDATACHEDSERRLWAISNSGGLFRLDSRQQRFVPVNDEYHIDTERMFSINEDKEGHLWFSTESGLVQLCLHDNGEHEVKRYAEDNGIGQPLFMPNASCRLGNHLFYGGHNSVILLDPALLPLQRKSYPLVLANIYLNGVPYEELDSVQRASVSTTLPSFTRHVTIPAWAEKIGFEVALLSYSQHNKYAYYLEGYDNSWQYLRNHRNGISFQNLPPGTYTLHLKGTNGNGTWQQLPYPITVSVLPPWYRTIWAYLCYFVLLASAVFMGLRYYRNYVKTRSRLQMGVILANITHELLTPLAVISASVDELRQEVPDHEHTYSLIQNNISRLTRLLRQILEVRKSQAGQLRLKVQEGNLTAFIGGICDNIRPMTDTRANELIIHMPDQPITGWFDPDKLDKIVYNLLSNAFKYNKTGGQVRVTLSTDGHKATLTVSDDGIGISPYQLKHLYTRFLDGDYRKAQVMGTGIGLSLTHDLVELHHGTIRCQSTEGQGTTFTVTLPIARQTYQQHECQLPEPDSASTTQATGDAHNSTPPNLPEPPQPDTHEYTMLLVEDNSDLLALMQRLLSKKYRVITAQDGQEAWDIICREELDIVISDVMMPVMNGLELTQRIKSTDDFALLPVILLTAKTRDEERQEGLTIGADEYLSKPIQLNELLLRVDNIIANRQRIRRRFMSGTSLPIGSEQSSTSGEQFIAQAIQCVKDHISQSDYDRESFAKDMCVSSSTLYNKLRALTGQNISGFVNSIRLKEACRIARANPGIQVSELAYRVGYNSPRYFTICFKKEYGMLLKEYLEKEQQG